MGFSDAHDGYYLVGEHSEEHFKKALIHGGVDIDSTIMRQPFKTRWVRRSVSAQDHVVLEEAREGDEQSIIITYVQF